MPLAFPELRPRPDLQGRAILPLEVLTLTGRENSVLQLRLRRDLRLSETDSCRRQPPKTRSHSRSAARTSRGSDQSLWFVPCFLPLDPQGTQEARLFAGAGLPFRMTTAVHCPSASLTRPGLSRGDRFNNFRVCHCEKPLFMRGFAQQEG